MDQFMYILELIDKYIWGIPLCCPDYWLRHLADTAGAVPADPSSGPGTQIHGA